MMGAYQMKIIPSNIKIGTYLYLVLTGKAYTFLEKRLTPSQKLLLFSTLIFLNIEKPLTLIFKKFPQEATTTKTMNIAYCFQEAR